MMPSIPAAIDWLVTNIGALTVSEVGDFAVADGIPTQADTLVCIGITPDTESTDATTEWMFIGLQGMSETYSIPCTLWATTGGTGQKTVRDRAFALFSAIFDLVNAHPGLDTAGVDLLPSGSARVTDIRLLQTTVTEAGEGRVAEIRFNVNVTNRITSLQGD